MGTVKRRGAELLLVVLPDGSRSLIPMSWTDWHPNADELPESGVVHGKVCLAPLADLLHARVLVDSLLGRCLIPQAPTTDEEDCHAADTGVSRSTHRTANIERSDRPRSTHRGSQDSCAHHRASDHRGRSKRKGNDR